MLDLDINQSQPEAVGLAQTALVSALAAALCTFAACSSEDEPLSGGPRNATVKTTDANDVLARQGATTDFAEYAQQCKDFMGGTYIDSRGSEQRTPKAAVARWVRAENAWQYVTGEEFSAPPGKTPAVAVYALRDGKAAARFVTVKTAKGWRPTSYIFCLPD